MFCPRAPSAPPFPGPWCLSLERAVVQRWLNRGVSAAPLSHLPSLSAAATKAGFDFISVVLREGSVKGLFCAGTTCHHFTDLSQTWKVIWLSFVGRQGDNKAKQMRRKLFSGSNCCRLNSGLRIKWASNYNWFEKALSHYDTAVFTSGDLKAPWKSALGLPKGVKMTGSPGRVSHVLTKISLLLVSLTQGSVPPWSWTPH